MNLLSSVLPFATDFRPLAPGTRRAYTSAAHEIVKLLGDTRAADSLTARDFLALTKVLSKREYAASTATTYAVVAKKYLLFLIREDLLVMSSADVLKVETALRAMRPKPEHSLPAVPTPGQLRDLVVAAIAHHDRQPPLYERDIALVEILVSTGMRIAEVAALKCGQIDRVRRQAVIRGKGKRKRVVYLSGPAIDALERYWSVRGDAASSSPALANHSDQSGGRLRPISAGGLRNAFDMLAARAGLPAGITPHKLRHAFASNLQHLAHDATIVQKALGHASLSTTQIYLHLNDDEVAAQVARLHQTQAAQ